jgi:hypothetical protein
MIEGFNRLKQSGNREVLHHIQKAYVIWKNYSIAMVSWR